MALKSSAAKFEKMAAPFSRDRAVKMKNSILTQTVYMAQFPTIHALFTGAVRSVWEQALSAPIDIDLTWISR